MLNPLLHRMYPLQEREFSLEISTENLKPDLFGVFVIYQWEWEDECTSCDNAEGTYSYTSNSSQQSNPCSPSHYPLATMPVTNDPTRTHVVVFKCIGAV